MAKKTFTVDVCDVCGDKGVASFRISEQGGESRKVTVCQNEEHGAPVLRALLKAAKDSRPSPSHGPGRSTRVYTMAEVAAARIRTDAPTRKGRAKMSDEEKAGAKQTRDAAAKRQRDALKAGLAKKPMFPSERGLERP